MMGTPNYMSPEQVQGHAVDGRADQFSLAVIAYEMLTGEKPFLADQLPALLFRIVREDPVPPQRLNPTLTPQVEVVLRKALSKNASERYLSCLEFVEHLRTACDLNPSWRALPRTVAQSLPTMGSGATGAGAAVLGPPRAPKPTRIADPKADTVIAEPSFLSTTERERRTGNPILKSLAWMLVGIGLVGLVLFGAQKYLFNRYSEPVASNQPPPADQDNASNKPSPVGDSAQTAKPVVPPAPPPDATKPESVQAEKPDAAAPPAAKPETANRVTNSDDAPPVERPAPSPPPARVRSVPAASMPPKAETEQQVQFVTEPIGARLTVDGNSELSCKAPCFLQLSPGRHSLNVSLDGYRPFPKIFNVPEQRDIFLQLTKASGTLRVTTIPDGATILVNGESQPQRTPALFNLPPGNYRIRVSRNGQAYDFDVVLHDGDFVTKSVNWNSR